jgi:hypothetical protein
MIWLLIVIKRKNYVAMQVSAIRANRENAKNYTYGMQFISLEEIQV